MEKVLCLNMIVRNESHVIRKTLENLLEKIPQIDYYVISDTGSTDDTIARVRAFFGERSIPGEIHEDEWRDFGHNRTLALRHAYGKSRFVFVFDADDEIIGTVVLPDLRETDGTDAFLFRFGGEIAVTYYCRILLISNRLRWRYRGVLHEFIECEDTDTPRAVFLDGPYSVVSGRSGWRNTFPDKYARDAAVLEEALRVETDPKLLDRYTFYCAQSWFDAGNHPEAERWYRKTLELRGWDQERYFSCLRLWMLASSRGAEDESLAFLVRSFEIDPERIDGVFELIRYYTDRGMYRVAWGYYGFIRSFYEKTSDDVVAPDKLFVNPWVSGFGLPYYTILLCERTGDAETARAMYRKIFRYRFPEKNTEQINGLLLRLERFFTEELREPLLGWLGAIRLAGAVVRDDLIDRYRYHALVYTGWAPFPWNGDTPRTRALGGSETMAAALAAGLHTRGWRVLVVGNVADTAATDDGPRYLHEDRAHGLLTACPFRLLVVSRDLTFLDRFRGVSAEKTIAWAHDVDVLGSHNLASPLSGIVFVSHWQKRLFLERYPSLPRERCLVIPNAVHPITPPEPGGRVANRFVYSSCVNRGLEKILAVWPTILAEIPDATLCVSTYNSFPRNIWEEELHRKMTALRGIKMLGSLSKQELYDTLATCEFWLYPTTFLETFCITAVEMMACGVLCVYYPVGALPETIGEGCGVPVEMGKEIETILSLSTRQKEEIRRAALRRIRERFLWTDRIDEWIRTIGAVKAPERIKIVFDKDMPRVDGSLLRRTPYLSRLFRGAEPRPEILSHLMLWRMLRLDSAYDAYLVIDGPPAPVDAPPGPHELRVEPGRYLLPKKDAPALLDRARAGGIGDDLRGFLLGKTAQAEEEEYDHRPTIGVLSPQAPPEITGIRFVAFSTDEPLSPGGYRYQTEAELNALLCSEGVDLLYTNSVANPFRSVNACPIMHAQNAKSVIDTQGLTRVFHGLFSTGSASGNKS